MKKNYILFLAASTAIGASAAVFSTGGTGKTFTFKQLSKVDTTGITKVGGAYVVANDFTVSENDTLKLENNDTVKLANKVSIIIAGTGLLNPSDTAYVTKASDTDLPKGFKFMGKGVTARLKNVTFDYVGVSFFSEDGKGNLQADNCTWRYYNGKLSSSAAINFSNQSDGNVIKNCYFLQNTVGAVASGSNTPVGLDFTNNYLWHNTTDNKNRPQINLTTGANHALNIVGNKVIGGKFTMVGGISVSNMLNMSNTGSVTVKDNIVEDNRYGITFLGNMNVEVLNNTIRNNKYETNANNGGSGISVYSNGQKTVVTGNLIEGNLWGATIINKCKNVNFGKTDNAAADDYNPGLNVFKDNGNNGVLYDLYNNTTETVYAQGNTWNVAVQDSASIEQVIFHKVDNEALGLVIFMPSKSTGVDGVAATTTAAAYAAATEAITSPEPAQVAVFTPAGALVAKSGNAVTEFSVAGLAPGFYIARVGNASVKFQKK